MVKRKIICTIGPASDTETTLRKMLFAGMDVARLNFSHSDRETHYRRIQAIRELNRKYRRNIGILGDLEGYRIRIGKFKERKEIFLRKRQKIILTNNKLSKDENFIYFNYPGSLNEIKIGTFIYIDDGNITLRVKSRSRDFVETEVMAEGVLKENKGVNISGINLKIKGIKDKDREDIEFALENKLDFIAQSFVRTKEDVLCIRKIIEKKVPQCKLIAKIENRQGIKNIDEIIEVSSGIMIARGDMGVCLPIYEVPIIQKNIIKKCKLKNKFVITATQMLESMTENPRPTRAEVSDVANAIIDGSDYLMLSAETAVGNFPAQAVEMMNQIIKFTEDYLKQKERFYL